MIATPKLRSISSLLRSLASEMEKAMQAIAHNRLPDLEESVSSQQHMSAELLRLSGEITPSTLSAQRDRAPGHRCGPIDADLIAQVRAANDALQKLNRRYAALLEHSSRSIALMAALFSGYQGNSSNSSRSKSRRLPAPGANIRPGPAGCKRYGRLEYSTLDRRKRA
jgi:hypothetical protein